MSALSFITVSVSSQNLLFPDMLLTQCLPDLLCLSHLLSSFCSQRRFSVWFLCAIEGCSSVFTDSCSLVYLMNKYYSKSKYSFIQVIEYMKMYQGGTVITGIKYTYMFEKWWLCSYWPFCFDGSHSCLSVTCIHDKFKQTAALKRAEWIILVLFPNAWTHDAVHICLYEYIIYTLCNVHLCIYPTLILQGFWASWIVLTFLSIKVGAGAKLMS